MQPYYAIKLKCFLVQVCAAGTLMITAICVFASALQEYLNGYRASARLAYPSSFIICGALFVCGLFILYEAFHFEKRVFGKKTNFNIQKTKPENFEEGNPIKNAETKYSFDDQDGAIVIDLKNKK